MSGIEFTQSIILAIIMTVIGSLARYANTLESKRIPLRSHVVISIFAGMTMFLYGLHEQWSMYLLGIGCGLAGWQGAAIIKRIHPPGFSQDDNGDNNGTN